MAKIINMKKWIEAKKKEETKKYLKAVYKAILDRKEV